MKVTYKILNEILMKGFFLFYFNKTLPTECNLAPKHITKEVSNLYCETLIIKYGCLESKMKCEFSIIKFYSAAMHDKKANTE